MLVLPFLVIATILFAFSIIGQNLSVHADVSSTPTPTPTVSTGKTLTFRASAQANGIFSDGVAVTLPSNIHSGDLLIAVAGTNGPQTSWYTPAGWTYGTNSNIRDTQGLSWWWKIADGTEAGKTIIFRSSRWEDGAVAVNVYEGQVANPIAGVSKLTTTDNDGVGIVTSAPVAGVSLSSTITAVPLLFVSWQEDASTITWPAGFGFESTASDGFATVDVAERLQSMTTDNFQGYTLLLSPAQAIVQTLQVLIRVQ